MSRDGAIGIGGSVSAVLSSGLHLITASVGASAGNHASAAINVAIEAIPGSTTVKVASQGVARAAAGGPNRKATCSIRIENTDGNPIAGAWVTADYTGPTSGSATAPAPTDANGEIVLEGKKTKNNLQSPWCFTVTDVSASGATWDAVASEVCEPS